MGERGIEADERSGVLHPGNLARYRARWFTPAAEVADVVETYWSVQWHLGAERIAQRIVAAPAVTLSLERGAVPAPLVVTGVHAHAWERVITGSGRVFGIRLRPAGLAVLGDLTPADVADATLPVIARLDERLHAFLAALPLDAEPEVQEVAADTRIARALADRPVPPLHLLANDVVARLAEHGPAPVEVIAAGLGVSGRTVQRALRATLGQGPSWVGRWIRLQEVVRLLSAPDAPPSSEVAAMLGYADQAHLVNDFRTAVGLTPGTYVRSLRELGAAG